MIKFQIARSNVFNDFCCITNCNRKGDFWTTSISPIFPQNYWCSELGPIGFRTVCFCCLTVRSIDIGSSKKFSKFFSNYAPTVLVFSRLSAIEWKKPFFEIRPGTCFFLRISIFVPIGLYMDQNRNKKKKACSRSNFEKRFGAIDSWDPGEC